MDDSLNKELFINAWVYAVRTVTSSSVDRFDQLLIQALETNTDVEVGKSIEYGEADGRICLKIKGKEISFFHLTLDTHRLKPRPKAQQVYPGLSDQDWKAITWVVVGIMDAFEFLPRGDKGEERLSTWCDGRLRSQLKFVNPLVVMSRLSYKLLPLWEKNVLYRNDMLMEAFFELLPDDIAHSNCKVRVEYSPVLVEPDRVRAGLRLKDPPYFVSDLYRSFCDRPLPDEIRAAYPNLTQQEWDTAIAVILFILTCFESIQGYDQKHNPPLNV